MRLTVSIISRKAKLTRRTFPGQVVFIKEDMASWTNCSLSSDGNSGSSSFKTTNAGPAKLYASCVNRLNVRARLGSNRSATNSEAELPIENKVREDRFRYEYERTERITVSLEQRYRSCSTPGSIKMPVSPTFG